jgi:protein O-GlcNAc transferase
MDEAARVRESLRCVELASSLLQEGHFNEAIKLFENALILDPRRPEIHLYYGNALLYAGSFAHAAQAYQNAIALNPAYVEAHNNLGAAKRESHRLHEAIEHFKAALKLNPNFFDAAMNLGTTYQDANLPTEALAAFRAALALRPNSLEILVQIVHLQQQLCDWTNIDLLTNQLIQRFDERPNGNDSYLIPPFALLALHHPTSPAQQLKCSRAWTDGPIGLFSNLPAMMLLPPRTAQLDSTPPHKIRVGYLSADFRYHATAFLIAELLEAHNREQFEIFAYSYGPNDHSTCRTRLERSVDCFRDIATTSFQEAADQIRKDSIDVLVDLKGLTQQARTEILGFRPAPIQVNFLGYPSTMGTRFVDYIIADPFIVPFDQQPHFTEKLVHLPDCYQPNDRLFSIENTSEVRSSFGLPTNDFVFCAFNNSYKISPRMFDVWIEILNGLPSSVLWIFETNPAMARNLKQEAKTRGVSEDRLVFSKNVDRHAHLARLQCADLFLDTFPVSGHTTASDALRAGLPLITIVGETFVSRVAGSLLNTLELNDLIATNFDDYRDKALALALSPNLLVRLKQQLRANLLQSSLFKPDAFASHLEAAYKIMWQRNQRGEAPSLIQIPARLK